MSTETKVLKGATVAAPGNIADPATAEAIAQSGVTAFGKRDILVPTAAIRTFDAFPDMPLDITRYTTNVNLFATFQVARFAPASALAAQAAGGPLTGLEVGSAPHPWLAGVRDLRQRAVHAVCLAGSSQNKPQTGMTIDRTQAPPLPDTSRTGRADLKAITAMPPRATIQPMNLAQRQPWTPEQFLAWAGTQEGRFEFDGIRPLAMTGGNANHSAVTTNIHVALRPRLRGTACSHFGPDLAVRTVGERIRLPDALITCGKFPGTDVVAPDVVVVFEVLSPTSGRTDRIEKVREYAMVPSIRRYIIVETKFAGVMVLYRKNADDGWQAATLIDDEILEIPEVGISLPVAELYEGVDLGEATQGE